MAVTKVEEKKLSDLTPDPQVKPGHIQPDKVAPPDDDDSGDESGDGGGGGGGEGGGGEGGGGEGGGGEGGGGEGGGGEGGGGEGGGDGGEGGGIGIGGGEGGGGDSGGDSGDGGDGGDSGDAGSYDYSKGDITVIDSAGNQYTLPDGGTYNLDNGQTVTISSDGTIQNVMTPEVTISSTYNSSTGELALTAVSITSDVNGVTFSAIGLAAEAPEILNSIGAGYTIAGIAAGGLVGAINIITSLYNNRQIQLRDVMAVFLAVLAALGLAFGLSEMYGLVTSLGATIWDLFEAMTDA